MLNENEFVNKLLADGVDESWIKKINIRLDDIATGICDSYEDVYDILFDLAFKGKVPSYECFALDYKMVSVDEWNNVHMYVWVQDTSDNFGGAE